MMRWSLALAFSIIVGLSIVSDALACGPSLLNVADCKIINIDAAGNVAMRDIDIAEPIGTIQVPDRVYFFSGPLCIVEASMRSTMQTLYAAFSDAFQKPFVASVLLYVVVYAISFMYGLVNPKDFALRLFKLAVVFLLVTDNCAFYNYLYGSFIGASNALVKIAGSVNADAAGTAAPINAGEAQRGLYDSLDEMFENIIGIDGMVQLGIFMLSALSADGMGTTAAMLGLLGFGSMALAMLRAMAALGLAFAGIAFFLLFTPMFLSFFLFQTTRNLFDSWMRMLISLIIQPFIIFIFLGMMRTAIDSVNVPELDINSVLTQTTDAVSSFKFEPEMSGGKGAVDVWMPDMEKIPPALGVQIDIDINGPRINFQQKYFDFFVPKLLFWFVINMIMAGFIKQIPNIAHRLGGFISGAPLLADGNMPGTSGLTGALFQAVAGNAGVKKLGAGAAAIGAAYGVNQMQRNQDAARDKNGNLQNQAKDGEAARDQANMTRAGTLGQLLGTQDINRDGATAGGIGKKDGARRDGVQDSGIGEKDGAHRDGTNIKGVGETEAAMRREMTNQFTMESERRIQAEKEQAIANHYAQKGAANVNALTDKITGQDGYPERAKKEFDERMKEEMKVGMTKEAQNQMQKEFDKHLKHAEENKLRVQMPRPKADVGLHRDMNIKVQDIKITTQRESTTTYMLNNKAVEVTREEEEKFLRTQLKSINNDIQKANGLGGHGVQEMVLSSDLRNKMQARLEVVLEEQKTLNELEKAEQELAAHIERDKAREVEKMNGQPVAILAEEKATQVTLANLKEEQKAFTALQAQATTPIEKLALATILAKLNKDIELQEKRKALYELSIADKEEALGQIRAARLIIPSHLQMQDIEAVEKELGKDALQSFDHVTDTKGGMIFAMEKYEVIAKEKEALEAIELEAARLRLENQSIDGMNQLYGDVHNAAQGKDIAGGVAVINSKIAELKKHPNAEHHGSLTQKLEELKEALKKKESKLHEEKVEETKHAIIRSTNVSAQSFAATRDALTSKGNDMLGTTASSAAFSSWMNTNASAGEDESDSTLTRTQERIRTSFPIRKGKNKGKVLDVALDDPRFANLSDAEIEAILDMEEFEEEISELLEEQEKQREEKEEDSNKPS